MTELTPRQQTVGDYLPFGLALIAAMILIATAITSHTPPRLATSAIIAAIVCSTASRLVPSLRNPMRILGLALLVLAIYAASKHI